MQKITELTIKKLREMLDNKEISSLDITSAYLENISCKDTSIGAFLSVTAENAKKQAIVADSYNKSASLLRGIPYALKDNICTKDIRTTAGAKMLSDFIPCYDATVVTKLKNEHAVLLGKLNMDEFSMGNSTKNSAFKITRNPVNAEYVPGGSSGGCAAAVSANMTPLAIGSDTGGSIRQPAAFCGVVGMKPTYGAVSRYGLISFASSFDQIGFITKNVYDNAIVFSALSEKDLNDSTSVDTGYASECLGEINNGIKNLKIAYISGYCNKSVNNEIKDAVKKALVAFEKEGAIVDEINVSFLKYALPAYYIISSAEASSNLARYDGIRYGYSAENLNNIEQLYQSNRNFSFGDEVKRRILLGTFVLSYGKADDYYLKALSVKKLITNELQKIFEEYDVIVSPTTPETAPKVSDIFSPVDNYNGDCFTVLANLAGIPAISIPCGTDKNGLPIGIQIMGKSFSENLLYKTAFAYENIRGK